MGWTGPRTQTSILLHTTKRPEYNWKKMPINITDERITLPGAENYRFMGLNWSHSESPPLQTNAPFHKRDPYHNSQNDVLYSVFWLANRLISKLPNSATVCNLAAARKSTKRNTVEYGLMYKSLLDTRRPSLAAKPNSKSIKLGNKQVNRTSLR